MGAQQLSLFKNKDSKYVRPIPRIWCRDFILKIHYARRWPSITYSFGLFDNDDLIGVITYGTPPSSSLRVGVCGKAYSGRVLELNRLCLKYNRKNEASFLVGKSLNLIGNDHIIVSFADTEQGHKGVVYQATNFIYCGLSAKRTDWKVKGKEHLHGQTVADEFRGKQNRATLMREKYGDDFYLKERPRKHRYVFFIGNKRFKKHARKELKYQPLEYPK